MPVRSTTVLATDSRRPYAFLADPPPPRNPSKPVQAPTPPRSSPLRAHTRGSSISENTPLRRAWPATEIDAPPPPRNPLTPIAPAAPARLDQADRFGPYASAWTPAPPEQNKSKPPTTSPYKRRQTFSTPDRPDLPSQTSSTATLVPSKPIEPPSIAPPKRSAVSMVTRILKPGSQHTETTSNGYVPRVARTRPPVARPVPYVQDAMIDEFFGDTRAMKGKRAYGTYGLDQNDPRYGTEMNWVDENGQPWLDRIDKQYHTPLMDESAQGRAAFDPAKQRLGPPGTWSKFDVEARRPSLGESTSGESFDSSIANTNKIRTASGEYGGYVPGVSAVEPSGVYVPHKHIPSGAYAFPTPAAPRHLDPDATLRLPRPHGPSRRRTTAADFIAPAPAPLPTPDSVETARLQFMKTSFNRPEDYDSRRSSWKPPSSSQGVMDGYIEAASRPVTRQSSEYRSPSSMSSDSRDNNSSYYPSSSRDNSRPPTRESTRPVDSVRGTTPSPNPSSIRSDRSRGPPTIQPRHQPTKSTSSNSLKPTRSTASSGRAASSEDEGARSGAGFSRTLTKSVSALFRKK